MRSWIFVSSQTHDPVTACGCQLVYILSAFLKIYFKCWRKYWWHGSIYVRLRKKPWNRRSRNGGNKRVFLTKNYDRVLLIFQIPRRSLSCLVIAGSLASIVGPLSDSERGSVLANTENETIPGYINLETLLSKYN